MSTAPLNEAQRGIDDDGLSTDLCEETKQVRGEIPRKVTFCVRREHNCICSADDIEKYVEWIARSIPEAIFILRHDADRDVVERTTKVLDKSKGSWRSLKKRCFKLGGRKDEDPENFEFVGTKLDAPRLERVFFEIGDIYLTFGSSKEIVDLIKEASRQTKLGNEATRRLFVMPFGFKAAAETAAGRERLLGRASTFEEEEHLLEDTPAFVQALVGKECPAEESAAISEYLRNGPFACVTSETMKKLGQSWLGIFDGGKSTLRQETMAEIQDMVLELYRRSVMQDPLKWMWKPAVSARAWKFILKFRRQAGFSATVPLGCTCGYGVCWATFANAVIWPGYVLFAYLAYKSSHCGPAENGQFAKYDNKLWALFLCFMALLVYMEYKAASYVFWVQAQTCGPFKFLGTMLRFSEWLLIQFMFCFLGHTDIASNGFFMATALFTMEKCPQVSPKIDPLWSQVLQQSMFVGHEHSLTLGKICLFAWGLTFLQPLYALAVAMPISFPEKPWFWPPTFCKGITYMPDMAIGEHKPVMRYRTLLDKEQNHGNALIATAEVARMGSVTTQDENFAMSKYEMGLVNLRSKKAVKDVGMCLHHAQGLLQRSFFRFLFLGLLEVSLQINLQVTLLGIQRAAGQIPMRSAEQIGFFATLGQLNRQTLFSIFLSLIMAVKRLYEVYTLVYKARMISNNVAVENVNSCQILQLIKEYREIDNMQWWNNLGAILYIGSCCYAAVKFWAVFYCPSSLWNLALWPPNGCAVLPNQTVHVSVNVTSAWV